MKKALVSFLFVLASLPALAVSTTSLTLTTSWQDLGVGPLQIQTNNQSQTLYRIDDSAPVAGADGFYLQGISQPQTISPSGTAHVYVRARSIPAKGPAPAVIYAPVSAGSGGGGGGGGGAITSPVGSNTKAQSVSVTYATDFLGQNVMANSVPVVIASNQTGIPTTSYGPTAEGTAPGQPPLYNGFKDGSGLTRGASPSTPLPATAYDQRQVSVSLSAAQGSFVDIPLNNTGSVGLRFAGLTASGATISYFTSNDATQTPADVINDFNAGTYVRSPTKSTDGPARIPTPGRTTLRLQVTTGGTGTITVSYNVTASNNIVDLSVPATGLPVAVGNFPTTQAVNQTQINGVTVATGAGASNTGTQRTVLATDSAIANTGFNALQAGAANASGNPFFTQVTNPYLTTTANALEPVTAASGKITVTSTAVAANTSTTIAATNASRVQFGVQCGSGAVNISETGAALASATFGAAGATLYVPNGSQPYFTPPVATRTAITAYTATAQTCVVTEYNR